MKRIALFASGTGSNALKIIEYFQEHPQIQCEILLSNKAKAPALEMAAKHGLKTRVLNRTEFYQSDKIVAELKDQSIDLLVLAGFLWLIPENLIAAFPNQIINIHPALLPKYGGKGMYGMNVHRAVAENQETESGITIHYVNAAYDEGAILFQTSCTLSPADTPEMIRSKVLRLEHQHFAPQIEKLLLMPQKGPENQ